MVKFNKILRLLREIIYIWDYNLPLSLNLKKETIKFMLNIELLDNYLMEGKMDQNQHNNQEDLLLSYYSIKTFNFGREHSTNL